MLRRNPWPVLALLLCSCSGSSNVSTPVKAEPKLVYETWHGAYIGGVKVGHVHTTVHENQADGDSVYHTAMVLNFAIQREGSVVPLSIETTTDETAEGKVVGFSMTQFAGGRRLTQRGRVNGSQVVLTNNQNNDERKLAWDDRVIGPYRQERYFRINKVKPGDRLTFFTFDPGLLATLTNRVTVKEKQTVPVLQARTDDTGTKITQRSRELLRVEIVPDKVMHKGTASQLFSQFLWLDDDRMPVRQEYDLPFLGRAVFYPLPAKAAQEAAAAAVLPDLLVSNSVPVEKVIDNPYDTNAVVYRITIRGDKDPTTAFARDDRQQVGQVRNDTFLLRVTARREPGAAGKADAVAEAKYLASTTFLDCDDARVKARAEELTRGEAGALSKARKIEKWVHANMRPTNAIGSATASQVLRDRTGDCRQHAMLTAALCRAAGIPARTATGMIYVHDRDQTPRLAYHMWTEVWFQGGWLALDATLGRGSVDACHLKIMDQDWADAHAVADHLPILRVVGKLKVEILSAR
jgi:hypothetical protein